jgi:hypothetical protein
MKIREIVAVFAMTACLLSGCKSKPASETATQPAQASQPDSSAAPSPATSQPAQAASPSAQASSPQVQSPQAQTAVPPPAPAAAAPVAAAPVEPPPPPPPPVVIPSGTELTVRLGQTLSSKSNSAGDPFDATLAAAVVVNGKTVLPVGTRISGRVTSVQKAGRFKGAGVLDLNLRSLTLHSTVYRIHTLSMSQTTKGKGKRTAAMVGGGVGGGALIGGLAGGGKGAAIGALVGGAAGTAGAGLSGDRNISMPAETAVGFQLRQPLTLPPDIP